jgi:hypothetical protein
MSSIEEITQNMVEDSNSQDGDFERQIAQDVEFNRRELLSSGKRRACDSSCSPENSSVFLTNLTNGHKADTSYSALHSCWRAFSSSVVSECPYC